MGNNVALIPKQPARHSLLTNTENVVYMPLASKHSHGIVKIGDGLNVTADGLISVNYESELFSEIKNTVDSLGVDVTALENALDGVELDVANLETALSNGLDSVDSRLTDIETGVKLIPVYQTKTDNTLLTVNKTVSGGINELKNQTTINIDNIEAVKSDVSGIKQNYATTVYVDNLFARVSMGGSQTYVFETRQNFIDWLDETYVRTDGVKPNSLNIGDMILIEEMGVPDYWVKSKSTPMTIDDFREYEAKIEVPEVKSDMISITKNTGDELQAVALKNAFKNIETAIIYSDFTGMIRLTRNQYKELVEYGSIEVDGEVVTFNEGALYIVPDPDSEEIQQQLDLITSELDTKADRAVVDQNTIDILQIQTNVTNLTPDIMRALKTPIATPSELKLVGVNPSNEQEMLSIGDGLLVENGSIKIDETLAKNDLSNVSYPTIVADGIAKTGAGDRIIERWISSDGQTWYEKYASGWQRCGGTTTSSGTSAVTTVQLPITFSNSNYFVTITLTGTTNNKTVTVSKFIADTKTISSFGYVATYVANGGDGYISAQQSTYYACGY